MLLAAFESSRDDAGATRIRTLPARAGAADSGLQADPAAYSRLFGHAALSKVSLTRP